jgi:prophage DNA circulation protein
MGQKARRVKIRCYFLNEQYEGHKELINHIGQTGHTYELTHPKYGIIKGQVESMVVRHDDRELTAEIDLTFIENLRGLIEISSILSVAAGTEEAFQDGQTELTEELTADIWDELGAYADEILAATELDADAETLLEQFSGISRSAWEYVARVDEFVGGLRSTLNQITNPANSLTSIISYATDLPGVVIGALAKTVERYAIAYNSLSSAPDRFLDSFGTGIDELVESSHESFGKYVRIAKAQRAAVEVGASFAADEQVYQAQAQTAQTATFDALGRPQRTIEPTEAMLTIMDIETALALVRTEIQTAVDEARGMQSLKTLAAALTDHVIEIKMTRPALKKVVVDNETPLHLLCLKYGLPYNDAERLVTINKLRHPSFVSGEVQVYVR